MTSQAATLHNVFSWILILGVGFAGVNAAQSDQFDCPPSVGGGPKRICPPLGPVGPISPPTPEHREKAERNMRETEARYSTQPQPVPQTGIFPGEAVREQLGTGSSAYLIENAWYEIVNGVEITVYAGAMRFDPANEAVQYDPLTAHGFVIVVKGRPGEPNTKDNQLYTPKPAGSLRIIAAKGNVLTLESRQGKKFSLNVGTEQLRPLGAR